MRVRLVAAAAVLFGGLILSAPADAATSYGTTGSSDGASGDVGAGASSGPSPGQGGGTGSRPPSSGGSGGGGGGGSEAVDTGPTRCEVMALEGRSCLTPIGDPATGGGGPPAPVVAPAVLAVSARESVPIVMPEIHTSPDGVAQLAGLETWFWLPEDQWQSVTARAEVPGLWVQVTATPTTSTWDPGDGSAAVVCDGPGRPHPGTGDASTDCGHTYTDAGSYTLTVEVAYAIEWVASTGESGTLDTLVLVDSEPIDVEQRQAVTD